MADLMADYRWVLLEEGEPYAINLKEEEANELKQKMSKLYTNLEYKVFYDEYYEYSEFY